MTRMINGLFCETCKQVHLNPSPREQVLAKTWGFFLCGMAAKAHDGENMIRTTVIVEGVRRNLMTMEVVK